MMQIGYRIAEFVPISLALIFITTSIIHKNLVQLEFPLQNTPKAAIHIKELEASRDEMRKFFNLTESEELTQNKINDFRVAFDGLRVYRTISDVLRVAIYIIAILPIGIFLFFSIFDKIRILTKIEFAINIMSAAVLVFSVLSLITNIVKFDAIRPRPYYYLIYIYENSEINILHDTATCVPLDSDTTIDIDRHACFKTSADLKKQSVSYFSGHSSESFAGATVVFVFIPIVLLSRSHITISDDYENGNKKISRVIVMAATSFLICLGLAFCVAICRIKALKHYQEDVIHGSLVGFFTGLFVSLISGFFIGQILRLKIESKD